MTAPHARVTDGVAGSAPGETTLRVLLALAVVLVFVLAAYSNALDGPFLWDDRPLIVDNPSVRGPASLTSLFGASFWASDPSHGVYEYYRPATALSYMLDYRVWGLSAAGFHATNVLLHLAVVGLVFALARRSGAGIVAASLAAALFGTAPRLTESVTWISGRTDPLAALAVLGALLIWDADRPARRLGAAALFGLGLLAKEVAVCLLPALFVLELDGDGSWRSRAARAARRVWPLTSVLAVVLVARSRALMHPTPPDFLGWNRPLIVLQSVAYFAGMIVDPFSPAAQIGRVFNVEPARVALGAGLALLLGAAALALRKRTPCRVAAFLMLAGAALLPVIHVLPIANNVIAADRFLYLPLAGIALAGAAGLVRAGRGVRAAVLLLGVAGASTFPFATHRRNEDWSDELGFWAKVVRETRWDNTGPRREVARILFRKARWGPFLRALETIPFGATDPTGRSASFLDLRALDDGGAAGLDAMGRYEWALQLLDDWARRDAGAPVVYRAAGRLQDGDFEGARAAARTLEGRAGCESCGRFLLLMRHVDAEALERVSRNVPAPTLLADRARRLRRVGGTMAERAWFDVVTAAAAPPADRLEAAGYLLQRGSRDRVLRALADVRRGLPDSAERQELLDVMAERDRDDSRIAEILQTLESRRREAAR